MDILCNVLGIALAIGVCGLFGCMALVQKPPYIDEARK